MVNRQKIYLVKSSFRILIRYLSLIRAMMSKTLLLFATLTVISGEEASCQQVCFEDCAQFCNTEFYEACCMIEYEDMVTNDLIINEPIPVTDRENEIQEHDVVMLRRSPLNDVIRLGKRSSPDMIRLGRGPSIDNILRLGKRSNNLDKFLRLGKRIPETTKRSDDMLRLGKRPALVDDVLRLGKRYGNDDMLRLGKRSLTLGVPAWLGKRTRLSISPAFNDVLRLGKRNSDDMLRLGKREA
ncbi:unnamed protein product [Lepeophtheirus salmonis]|uniref:(salmon louse) hypothetical protein n=1 Tax=Lepeophtheirus salmonis TaxID=72036 RepID=A0A7R8H590_LEPSM|nr:unnamed protein product [Lepeophtheirus salmonis]CAF2872424.1 unnamed protein product [Lepeophtheirus salmonis]